MHFRHWPARTRSRKATFGASIDDRSPSQLLITVVTTRALDFRSTCSVQIHSIVYRGELILGSKFQVFICALQSPEGKKREEVQISKQSTRNL